MKNYLTFIFLLFSTLCFSQFYDDFSDGNYTANPRWFMSDMEAEIVSTDNGYGVELHPTGELNNNPSSFATSPKTGEEYNMHKGTFRTANTLTDNTWWGCDLTFEINKDSEGEIKFYISSSLPSLGDGSGFFLKINLENRLISFIYENKTTETLATSEQPISYGTINLTCQITCNNKNWSIECNTNNNKTLNSKFTTLNSIQSTTSTGFLLIENPNNPYNLRINSVNCGDKPTEAEMISSEEIKITEIMAKPNPAVGLPEVEWIEVYNTTEFPLSLNKCKILTPAKTGTLGEYILEPHDYAILCSYNAAVELSVATTKICIVESMPALNNTGNMLTLKNKQNHTISFVEYSDDWYYTEPFKKDGGWSLERIDPTNPLSNETTWAPSVDLRGGTPAEKNSIARSLPDTLTPRITGIGVNSEKLIQIYFNKPMQGKKIDLQEKISVSGNSIKSLEWIEPKREILEIGLVDALDSTITIEISFSEMICISGWSMSDTTITLALPLQVEYMDIVFNELTTYVDERNSKFVELYNNSDYYIDLSKLMISNRDEDGNLKNSKIITQNSIILAPQMFAVISPDTSLIHCSLGINRESIYLNTPLPSMPRTDGVLVLTNRGGKIVDEVHYSEKWHHPMLTDLHNISLERIDPMANTQDKNNWHSVASEVGYNTAGWKNSQQIKDSNTETSKHFWLENSTFSPDNDGHNDLLMINYRIPQTGYIVTIDVYTRHGAHVCKVTNNQLIATEGHITWNGKGKNDSIVDSGIYVVVIQTINLEGRNINQKLIAIKI